MYAINIKNCNNIREGNVVIAKNKLNIKYGINGTGKTTLSKGLKFCNSSVDLQQLKSYFSSETAAVTIVPEMRKVLVFDEDFVNQVVFKEDEVIENSFEIFLKTPQYDDKKRLLDEHLKELHNVVVCDEEILALKKLLDTINSKFKRTNNGNLNRSGTLKSILAKTNIYNVPEELNEYKDFFDNGDINIPWIEWKNRGDDYDVSDKCPYCTVSINRTLHNERKEVFKTTYNKTNAQHLKEILELFEQLKEYMDESRFKNLIMYIKNDTPENVLVEIVDDVVKEIERLLLRLNSIEEFGRKKLALTEISEIEQQIQRMTIQEVLFNNLCSDKMKSISQKINEKVDLLLNEVNVLKTEMGQLKGVLLATVTVSQRDINEFLKTAGINYELVIDVGDDENKSRTFLRECFTEEKGRVSRIKKHLSWGEKNAFSLILFMYYAVMQSPDLIVLDDPVSSFDANKKYAILHRLFKNNTAGRVSFTEKTVLLLTHDFEPIIDFLVVGKLSNDKVTSSFLWNKNKELRENEIDVSIDVKLITTLCYELANNSCINIVSRIAFLRKLCELNECKNDWGYAYEILSSLIHKVQMRRKLADGTFVELTNSEKTAGTNKIKEYISDFNYDNLLDDIYNIQGIKNLYITENNSYFKIQLFRAMIEVDNSNAIRLSMSDDAWFKFIDETYHIENESLYNLDVLKFDVVPEYIMRNVDEVVGRL